MCVWNIHSSLSLSAWIFLCILQYKLPLCGAVCMCVILLDALGERERARMTSGESLRRVWCLTVARRHPDASHLRRRRRRPSEPSACLSPLIDLSLNGGVWECFGENMYFWQMLGTWVCTVHEKKKRAGPWLEGVFDARRWISRLCDALSCLKKCGGELNGVASQQHAIWFVFLVLQSALNSFSLLYGTSLMPASRSLTKPALCTLFRDSCLNVRKHYHRRGWPHCRFDSAWYSFQKQLPIIKCLKRWSQYMCFLTQ